MVLLYISLTSSLLQFLPTLGRAKNIHPLYSALSIGNIDWKEKNTVISLKRMSLIVNNNIYGLKDRDSNI